MRSVVYQAFGAAVDVLKIEEMAKPEPGPGEVLVRLHASAVNPSDVKLRAGARAGSGPFPYAKIIPHSDGAGVIEAVGAGVKKERIGKRVWIFNGQWRRAFGTAAEYIALNEEQAVDLADHVSFDEGAVLGIPATTACHAVLCGGDLEGKTVLVGGGAGTVGRLAIQAAVASGAHVLATASKEAGFEAARTAGACAVFDYKSPDLAREILARTDGVDHIIEGEFGQNVETHAAIIRENGTMATYGSALMMTPTLPFYPLMFKSVTLHMILVYLLTPAQRQAVNKKVGELLDAQKLDLKIHQCFDLQDAVLAHEIIESGKRSGAVILNM